MIGKCPRHALVAPLVAKRRDPALYGSGPSEHKFAMGSWRRWEQSASVTGGLEQAGGGMLRHLDPGRELLPVPVQAKWRDEHLGGQRRDKHL
jgi:hypothetical protein